MVPVRWSRVILGGLAAGVVINAGESLMNGVLLAEPWAEAMRALNQPGQYSPVQVAAFNLWGFLMGIAAVWLYASVRDHYGPGVRTAVYAGLAVWAIGYAFGTIPSVATRMFPVILLAYGALMGLIEIVVGTILGAWIYRPMAGSARQAAA